MSHFQTQIWPTLIGAPDIIEFQAATAVRAVLAVRCPLAMTDSTRFADKPSCNLRSPGAPSTRTPRTTCNVRCGAYEQAAQFSRRCAVIAGQGTSQRRGSVKSSEARTDFDVLEMTKKCAGNLDCSCPTSIKLELMHTTHRCVLEMTSITAFEPAPCITDSLSVPGSFPPPQTS